ncbi:hypothetical protein GE639_22245 [Salmonella enterica]|nr:hypothetical protein [Salmonella enterica]
MKSWYLIYYRTRLHEQIKKEMQNIGVEFFMPVYTKYTARADRTHHYRTREAPLFPGYLFIYFSPEDIHTTVISRQPSVIGFVRFGHRIQSVHDEIILTLQKNIPGHFLPTGNNIGVNKKKPDPLFSNMLNDESPEKRNQFLMTFIERYSRRERTGQITYYHST